MSSASPKQGDHAPAAPSAVFDGDFRAELDRLFQWRRDVRHFETRTLPPGTLPSLLATACRAPNVGLSQPWRFVRVSDEARRAAIRASFARCNADALGQQSGERAALYARLKLEGLTEAPEQVAVFVDDANPRGGGLGRATMPETLGYSAVLAIHTLWLAATAQGLGVGWVSILDPNEVARALDVPESWRFIAYLCIGYPRAASDTPELEREGWERRCPPQDFILER